MNTWAFNAMGGSARRSSASAPSVRLSSTGKTKIGTTSSPPVPHPPTIPRCRVDRSVWSKANAATAEPRAIAMSAVTHPTGARRSTADHTPRRAATPIPGSDVGPTPRSARQPFPRHALSVPRHTAGYAARHAIQPPPRRAVVDPLRRVAQHLDERSSVQHIDKRIVAPIHRRDIAVRALTTSAVRPSLADPLIAGPPRTPSFRRWPTVAEASERAAARSGGLHLLPPSSPLPLDRVRVADLRGIPPAADDVPRRPPTSVALLLTDRRRQ